MLTKQEFANQIGSVFSINLDDDSTHDIELIEVESIQADTTQQGQPDPFSLLFRASGESGLAQGTYMLKHADAGEILLFIVPIGPDDVGMRYEAVFT